MIKSLTKLLGSTTFAQLLLIIISPILTRVYSPDIFGEYVSLISIAYIVNSIALARMDVALFSASDSEVSVVFSLGLYFTTATTIITLFSIFTIDIVNSIKGYYYLIPLLVFALSTYQLIIALFLRYEKINYVSKNKMSQSAFLGLGQISLGLLSSTVYSIVIAQFLSFMLTSVFRFKEYNKQIQLLNPIKYINKYKNFIIYDTGSNFFQKLSNNLTPILVTLTLGAYVGGLYYMSYRVLIMPVSIFSISISQIISSKYIANINNEDWTSNNDIALRVMVFIFAIPFALLAAHIEPIVPMVFGADWESTGTLIRYFSSWVFLLLIYSSFSIHFSLNSKSKEIMILNIFLLINTVLSFYVLDFIGISKINFLIAIGFINTLAYLAAVFYLSLKNGFNSGLNLLVTSIAILFIIGYPYISGIYSSILILVLYILSFVFFYKKLTR